MTGKQLLIPFLLALTCSLALPTRADFDAADQFSDELRSGGSGPLMVVLPEGSFTLGGGRNRDDNTGVVRIDYLFAIASTEITNGQYRQFLTASRSGDLDKFTKADDKLPAAGISWDQAEAYVTWLSRESGNHYRLPSASEWEYAARANTLNSYFWGDKHGENNANCLNCKSPFSGRPGPVGSFAPNGWKLYDMHGNVWEWTKDCVDANSAPPPNGLPQLFGNCESRELRGGSAESDAWSIRAGARAFGERKMRSNDVGFRVVMDNPE